jgi:hydroxyacylglutathione hydrolase
VAETHIHADFVSGARALAAITGATLYVSGEGGPDWQYSLAGATYIRVVRDGDVIDVGRIRLDVVHTPGHTPEHLVYVVTDTPTSHVPLGVLTGDFLFVGDVGRPDLLETAAGQAGTMQASAHRLFSSLQTLEAWPDHLVIWPGHGSGSACGKSLGGVPVSSLGYERLTNWALRERSEEAFVAAVLRDQPDPPMYFAEMKGLNKTGAPAWSRSPELWALDAVDVQALVDDRRLIIDVRAGSTRGSLPGAIALPLGRNLSAWAGSVVPSAQPFAIVATRRADAEAARHSLALIGRPDAAGWISATVLAAYRERGGLIDAVAVTEAPRPGETLLDVRTTAEWDRGHLDGAVHAPLARLAERLTTLDPATPVLLICQAGTRAAVAASAMRRLGFSHVTVLDGGLNGYERRRGVDAIVR